MKRTILLIAIALLGSTCFGQAGAPAGKPDATAKVAPLSAKERARMAEVEKARKAAQKALNERISRGESEGVAVRIKDIARFRGVRDNQLSGYGLVVGLEGTGDTQSTPFTAGLLANAMKRWGTMVDPTKFKPKNMAAVSIIATLPPFAAPGNRIDVSVQSVGDAKSLQGGTLLMAPLYGPSDSVTVMASAQGAVSIGGFNVQSNGSSVQKNHTNAGRIPGGAIVESGVPTQMVFDGKLYLELDDQDLTTAQRVAQKLGETFPDLTVAAEDGGTIGIVLPAGATPMMVMSQIEATTVNADIPAVVVVNERTGTIVIGGNVHLGPAVIAHGGLQVRVDAFNDVIQPAPFSDGVTAPVSNSTIDVHEETAQIGLVPPSATIGDLANILQALKVTPRDVIAILQALREQGALKARIKLQ